jgi:hypothetical protein
VLEGKRLFRLAFLMAEKLRNFKIMRNNQSNPLWPATFAGFLWGILLLLLTLPTGEARGQMTPSFDSFYQMGYESFVIASDTAPGGRQAIQTTADVQFSVPGPALVTNVFWLKYQLLDLSGQPVPILDQNGNSNVTYSVWQTNILPVTYSNSSGPLVYDSEQFVYNVPLQPLTPLTYYGQYTPRLQIYSSPLPTNGAPVFQLAAATNATPEQYLDFTNTTSPDASPNLLVVLTNEPNFLRTWSISNSPGQSGFPVGVTVEVARYDDYTLPAYPTNTTVTLNFQLLNAGTGAAVPLLSTQAVFNVSIASHDDSVPPNPAVIYCETNFNLMPAVQLDSVDATYQLVVSLAHTVGAATVGDYASTNPATQLLDFNGQFYFGPFLTYFTNLDQSPAITATTPGTSLECQLNVSANAGLLPQAPGFTYGNGAGIDAQLLVNGTVQLGSGALAINGFPGSQLATQTVQNISFLAYSARLSTAGATEGATLLLPTGFSVALPGMTNRLTTGSIPLGTVPLDNTLNPQDVTIPGPIQAVAENVPFWFCGTSLAWAVDRGRLSLTLTNGVFVRQTEDDLLTSVQGTLADPTMANRVSNDGYFRNASIVKGQFLAVTADANGLAQLSGYMALNPPELRPHFPYSGSQNGVQIPIGLPGGNNGSLTLSSGVITPDSFLAGNNEEPAPLIYGRDTQDTNCASALAGPGVLPFTPQANVFRFTADGGLLASGSVPVTNLTWGYVGGANYAQEALSVQNGVFEMAGTFLAGGQSTEDSEELPAVLLFSGFGNGTNTVYVERPGTPLYTAGLASYPGLNFTAPATGSSCLGGSTVVNYPLATDSKYYARYGGVSGIQDAASFPSTLTIYGYSFTFTSYRLSFLDGEVDQSLTDGAIKFPVEPAGFTQPFSDLMLTDRGYLESAGLPVAGGNNHLNYWNVDFTPESLSFASQTNDTCGTGQRFLVLGAETRLPLITNKLHAVLGFWPSGNLVTVADGVSGCDSRFAVPGQLKLACPSGGAFTLSTVNEGYFNNYSNSTPGSPTSGFFNLAGKLRVPFFTDIRVHLHVVPLGGPNAQIFVMGGWPDPTTTATNAGWNEGSQNFFNTAKFDPSAQGFPADQNITCGEYETSTSSAQYHPLAQRNWIQVATFEYPLTWNPASEDFQGFQTGTAALPILTVGSNLKELSPGKVDLDFVQDLSIKLPVVKVLDLVNDVVGGDEAFQSLSNAVASALGSALDNTGLNELQGLLREDPTTLFQPILTNAFSGAVDQIYDGLKSLPQGNTQAFLQSAYNQIAVTGSNPLYNGLQRINGAPGQANTLVGQIYQTMTDAKGDVNQFAQILAKNGNGSYPAMGNVVKQLINDQAPNMGFGSGVINSAMGKANSLVANYGSALDELHKEFQNLSSQFDGTLGSLANSGSDFVSALAQPVNDGVSAPAFVALAASNLTNFLAGALTPAGDYFTANPTAVKQAIQQQLQNAFLNSPLASGYQTALRQFLFDNNATLDELMDDTFDQVNDAIRDGLSQAIDNADANFVPCSNLSKLMTAKIRGSPTFNGDSLRKIHLNASVQMDMPDPMTFNAYMEVKELCSQTVPVDCIPSGDAAAEVTLGAKNVTLNWPALNPNDTPLTLSMDAKWTLQDQNVVGLGGSFDVQGQIGVDGYSLNEIGATLAFGKTENYFAAKVAGTFTVLGVPINANGGIFVGEACTVNPIMWLDPQAGDTLSANNLTNFSGIYVDCGESLSLSQILFGESSCALDIGASMTGAVYYECSSWPHVNIGMRQSISLDASLLCLISGNANVTLSEIVQCQNFPTSGYSLTLAGDAQVCGSIGPCPFCISGCKTISIIGTVKEGGIDYSINY